MIRVQRTSSNVKNQRVWHKTAGRCWFCGTSLLKPKPDHHSAEQRLKWYTIDHATPRSRGGTDDIHNLLPSCSRCNNEKCDMNVEEYRKHLLMRRHNVPYFSNAQLDYLQGIGVDILAGLEYEFWGEKHMRR